MKIAMPTDDKTMESNVCASFGRAPYFFFYDTITKENYFLDNSAVASQGGAGIRAAQVISDHGIKALLTPQCGKNAAEFLGKAEVLIYQSIPKNVQQNIDAFLADRLPLLNDIHEGFHGHHEAGH